MPSKNSAGKSDRNIKSTDAESYKNYAQEADEDNNVSFDSPSHRESSPLRGDNTLPPDLSADEDDEGQEKEANPKRRMRSGKAQSSNSEDPEASGTSDAQSFAGKIAKSSDFFKQKAKDLVTRGSETIASRYPNAYDDVKIASRKVQDEIKKQPHKIAMGAAGVVGLGVLLAKRYSQTRDVKTPRDTPESNSDV